MGLEEYDNTTSKHLELRDAQRLYTYTPASARQPSTSSTLKFMTFNMQSGFLASCVSNVAAQTSFIQSMSVDYIASEEVDVGVSNRCGCNIAQQIADAAGITSVFGMTVPYGTGLYGTNTGTSQIILEKRNQLLAYSGVEQRMIVAVRTQPLALQGRNLWFATVHVEYYNDAARWSQLAQVVQFLNGLMAEDPKAVVVAGGDFNGGPWDQGYSTFKNAGFKNAWETFYGSINDGNTIPSDWPGSRFDHIWFKAPSDVTITVPQAVVPNVLLSDHRPFWATLTFSVGGSGGWVAPTAAPVAPTLAPTTAPTLAPTKAPTAAPVAPTAAPIAPTAAPKAPTSAPPPPVQATTKPTSGNTVKLNIQSATSTWWFAASLSGDRTDQVTSAQLTDSGVYRGGVAMTQGWGNVWTFAPTSAGALTWPVYVRATLPSGSSISFTVNTMTTSTVDSGALFA